MEIKLNHAAIREIQRKADKHVQDIVRKANTDMKGRPALAVEAELTRRLKAGGVEPNAANVREVAEAISKGELEG